MRIMGERLPHRLYIYICVFIYNLVDITFVQSSSYEQDDVVNHVTISGNGREHEKLKFEISIKMTIN